MDSSSRLLLKIYGDSNFALDSNLGRCYYDIGMIYKKKVNMSKAKKYFGIASKIYEEELPALLRS
jgi:hypothetical protein